MNNDIFSKRLKQMRIERGMSQQELSKKIGMCNSAINTYEMGHKKPSYEVVAKIAKEFHVSMDWLCGIDKNNYEMRNFSEFLKIFFKVIKSNAINLDCDNDFKFKFRSQFNNFEKTFIHTFNLYKNGTIDEKLFDLWCNNEIDIYKDTFIIEKQKI